MSRLLDEAIANVECPLVIQWHPQKRISPEQALVHAGFLENKGMVVVGLPPDDGSDHTIVYCHGEHIATIVGALGVPDRCDCGGGVFSVLFLRRFEPAEFESGLRDMLDERLALSVYIR